MGGKRRGGKRRGTRRALVALGGIVGLIAGPEPRPAPAADYPEILVESGAPPPPRYFPRGDGEAGPSPLLPPPPPRRIAGCAPRRAPVPTNAPGDPSYAGSAYGLAKPSYYGFVPPLGFDDPFGRPLRYCP